MFDLTPSLLSQIHMQQILGFGLDPLPPFGTMSLNPVFFFFEGVPNLKQNDSYSGLCIVGKLFEVFWRVK